MNLLLTKLPPIYFYFGAIIRNWICFEISKLVSSFLFTYMFIYMWMSVELSTVTPVLYLNTNIELLVLEYSIFFFNTFQREILYFLLLYIYMTAVVAKHMNSLRNILGCEGFNY